MTRWALGFVLGVVSASLAFAAEMKTVPRLQAIPLPQHQISFQRDGVEFCRLHFGPDQNRPFIYPVNGRSGRSLTRLGHPHDPEGHSHHNSVWISHNDINGVSFWEDRGRGRILHRRLLRLTDGQDEASALTENAWVADTNRVVLVEHRLTSVRELPSGEYFILIDLELSATEGEVILGKTPFGMIGVRLARSIGVNDGGGRILNSEGGLNEAGTFWKPARWVDYSGPIATGLVEGVTLMDHPSNPNHPAVFHTRNDGWMGASLTHREPLTVRLGALLKLRYGLYVHGASAANGAYVETAWKMFTEFPIPTLQISTNENR